MNKLRTCRTCKGLGTVNMTKRIGATGLFGWREPCKRCEGRGYRPHDPWVRPVLICAALIFAYFVWQFTLR